MFIIGKVGAACWQHPVESAPLLFLIGDEDGKWLAQKIGRIGRA